MRFRKLRVAWSVAWGIACLLFAVNWANSNVSVDFFSVPVTQAIYFKVVSLPNECAFGMDNEGFSNGDWYKHTPADDWLQNHWAKYGTPWSAEPSFFMEGEVVFVPYWFVVLWSATFAIAAMSLELRWHFNLRALLIATTLVAVVLGLAVYAAK